MHKYNDLNMENNQESVAGERQEFLTKMESKMKELNTILSRKNEKEIKSEWLQSKMIPKLLGISRKTWQTYRDKRLIPFAQIGSKIYVRKIDLEDFMKSHYIDSDRLDF